MLKELHINNFAIIDKLKIPFGAGLNVITGETGAGKSIIVQALNFAVGDRAASDVIRSGADEASVVAVFDNLTIRRLVSASGRSKVYINGKAASLAELRSVSSGMVEISSQHEHQRLLNEETHLEIVDRFGGLEAQAANYMEEFGIYSALAARLDELQRLKNSATEQREFLSYQIREIDAAGLKEGEEEELEKERNVARYAARLTDSISAADQILYSSETSVSSAINKVSELLNAAADIDPAIAEWLPISEQAVVSIDELARNVNSYLERLSMDPARLDEIEARLYEIKRLKKKYGGTIGDILAKRSDFALRLDLIENSDVEIKKTSKELELSRGRLKAAAEKLSRERAEQAGKLSALIQKELTSLGLEKTTFTPGHLRLKLEEAGESGIDRFAFQISPNPGEPLKALAKIASGGELSRIMLAIKRVLMDRVASSALEVFDEVDVGIGGAVAEMVGRKLKEMSKSRQVISITHLPQVASLADNHIVVAKRVERGRTVTRFETLSPGGRVDEIARMLGGSKITTTTRDHAREMLSGR